MDPQWHESLGEMRADISTLKTQVSAIGQDVRDLRMIEARRAGGWKMMTAMLSAAVVIGGLLLRGIDMWFS